jgi:two-component system, NarL family, nitrate/nitrite response regulator NarL
MRIVPTILVEKNTLFREGLSKLLAGTTFRVAATVSTADDLKPNISSELRSMLIVLGLGDGDTTMERSITALRSRFCDSRIVVLADHYDADQLIAAFRMSANGYLTKSISCEALIKSLELTMLGESIVPSAILARMASEPELETVPDQSLIPEDTVVAHTPQLLSGRETQILQCLISGQSNKLIARKFDIMEATVKVHIKAILRKIRVQNRTQAAIWAINHLEPAGDRFDMDAQSGGMARALVSARPPAVAIMDGRASS